MMMPIREMVAVHSQHYNIDANRHLVGTFSSRCFVDHNALNLSEIIAEI